MNIMKWEKSRKKNVEGVVSGLFSLLLVLSLLSPPAPCNLVNHPQSRTRSDVQATINTIVLPNDPCSPPPLTMTDRLLSRPMSQEVEKSEDLNIHSRSTISLLIIFQ